MNSHEPTTTNLTMDTPLDEKIKAMCRSVEVDFHLPPEDKLDFFLNVLLDTTSYRPFGKDINEKKKTTPASIPFPSLFPSVLCSYG